jgi:hypothetical protein
MNARHECPLFPALDTVPSTPRRFARGSRCPGPSKERVRRIAAREQQTGFRPSARARRTENARIVRCLYSRLSRPRNSARVGPRRETGVGLPPDAGAGKEERFVPESIGPRRSQAGRLPKEEAPPVHRTHRGAAMARLAGPSRAGEDIVSLNLIIQAAESGFNELPCSIPLYALGAGRLARVARGDQGWHLGDGEDCHRGYPLRDFTRTCR